MSEQNLNIIPRQAEPSQVEGFLSGFFWNKSLKSGTAFINSTEQGIGEGAAPVYISAGCFVTGNNAQFLSDLNDKIKAEKASGKTSWAFITMKYRWSSWKQSTGKTDDQGQDVLRDQITFKAWDAAHIDPKSREIIAQAPKNTYQGQQQAPAQQAPAQQAPAPAYQAPAPTQQAPAPAYQAPAPTQQAPAPAQQASAPAQSVDFDDDIPF